MKINWKSFVSGVVLGSVLFSSISFAAPSVVKLLVNGAEIHTEVSAQIYWWKNHGSSSRTG
jgi:integral membrane sensor domain MASE1